MVLNWLIFIDFTILKPRILQSSIFLYNNCFLLEDDKGCFLGDGSGDVYGGKVNYGKNFAPCLAWDEVPNCPFNAFDPRFVSPNKQFDFILLTITDH